MKNVNFKDSLVKIPKDILVSIERCLGVNLPKSYREFLLSFNGGYTLHRTEFNFKNSNDGSVIDAFLGINSEKYIDILWHVGMYANRIPDNMLPIATDTFGNLILIATKMHDYGKVYFWDHEREAGEGEKPDYSNLTLIADSFEEFINNLKSEEEVDAIDS